MYFNIRVLLKDFIVSTEISAILKNIVDLKTINTNIGGLLLIQETHLEVQYSFISNKTKFHFQCTLQCTWKQNILCFITDRLKKVK